MAYDDASSVCSEVGGQMWVPNNLDENDLIGGYVLTYTGDYNIWIGVNDIDEEGIYAGNDGIEMDWTNWNNGMY